MESKRQRKPEIPNVGPDGKPLPRERPILSVSPQPKPNPLANAMIDIITSITRARTANGDAITVRDEYPGFTTIRDEQPEQPAHLSHQFGGRPVLKLPPRD